MPLRAYISKILRGLSTWPSMSSLCRKGENVLSLCTLWAYTQLLKLQCCSERSSLQSHRWVSIATHVSSLSLTSNDCVPDTVYRCDNPDHQTKNGSVKQRYTNRYSLVIIMIIIAIRSSFSFEYNPYDENQIIARTWAPKANDDTAVWTNSYLSKGRVPVPLRLQMLLRVTHYAPQSGHVRYDVWSSCGGMFLP